MGLKGQGVLAIWHGIAEEAEHDFWQWHDTEHIPERVGIPGFLRGRRYRSVEAPRQYLDFYEVASVETIRSAPYLARLNDPTPWTRRVVVHFRDTVRLGFRVLGSWGRGQGGGLVAIRLRPAAGEESALRRALLAEAPGWLREPPGVVGVHVLETVPEVTQIPTEEKRLRGSQTEGADPEPLLLLAECVDAEVAGALRSGPLGEAALTARGVGAAVAGTYRLQITMDPA